MLHRPTLHDFPYERTSYTISWGAKTGTSDIVHTANTASFALLTPGFYMVTCSLTTSTAATGISVCLQQNSSTIANQSVYVGVNNTSQTFKFPLVTIVGYDTLQLSLIPNGANLVLKPTCAVAGAAVAGSLPCSYLQIIRVG